MMFYEATDTYVPSVATLFQKKWTHNTQCPEIRAIYKIVSTTTSLKKYERYLSVSFTIVDSSPCLTHAVTEIKSKPKVTLLRKTNLAETRKVDGTERRGSVTLEMKE